MSDASRANGAVPASSGPEIDQTRAALRKYLARDTVRGNTHAAAPRSDEPESAGEDADGQPASVVRVVGAAVGAWWEQNPLSVVPRLAKPLITEQVRKHPWQAVGIAAAVGGVIVLLRPWRRLPVANMAGALLRTTSLSAVTAAALAAMQASMSQHDDDPTRNQPH